MKKYKFTASEVIAFLRIMRPGSVVGPQQNYLARLVLLSFEHLGVCVVITIIHDNILFDLSQYRESFVGYGGTQGARASAPESGQSCQGLQNAGNTCHTHQAYAPNSSGGNGSGNCRTPKASAQAHTTGRRRQCCCTRQVSTGARRERRRAPRARHTCAAAERDPHPDGEAVGGERAEREGEYRCGSTGEEEQRHNKEECQGTVFICLLHAWRHD